jgi:hypothetical protein
MTTEVLAQALSAAQQATFGGGRIWYLKTAIAPVSISCEKRGGTGSTQVRRFINVGAGFKFVAAVDDGWTYLRMTNGATPQNIEIIIGDDDVTVSNAVSVTGAVTTVPSLASAIATPADIAIPTANKTSIAANLSRRSITIGSLAANTGNVRIQIPAAGAGFGLELQPGQWETFPITAALDVRNDSGATQTIWQMELS